MRIDSLDMLQMVNYIDFTCFLLLTDKRYFPKPANYFGTLHE
jgi:hypothetical protein